MSTELKELTRAVRNRHLDRYMERGGRVVGHACVATPRELFDAAGLLPLRIRAMGSNSRDEADAHMSRFNCSFCRSCLQLGLDGTYDFLDGIIETNGCDHLRGMFENWQHARPRAFFHYLRVPHLIDDMTLEVFAEELELLRRALADHYEVEISDKALREVFVRQNRVQGKLRRLREFRERARPTLSGEEALSVALAESALPPEVFEPLVDDLLSRLPGRTPMEMRARLLLSGSATDELELVREMERLGGVFVADGLCYSSRTLREPVALDRDPMEELARVYLRDLFCPRMFDDYPRRLATLKDAAHRANVSGAILVHNQFCDLHGVENARLRLDLEAEGIPVLVLEKEYGSVSDLGRIRTRVQAFLERIST